MGGPVPGQPCDFIRPKLFLPNPTLDEFNFGELIFKVNPAKLTLNPRFSKFLAGLGSQSIVYNLDFATNFTPAIIIRLFWTIVLVYFRIFLIFNYITYGLFDQFMLCFAQIAHKYIMYIYINYMIYIYKLYNIIHICNSVRFYWELVHIFRHNFVRLAPEKSFTFRGFSFLLLDNFGEKVGNFGIRID